MAQAVSAFKREVLEAVWLRDIQRKPISWLWKPYIQRGAINILTGDPGVGKSTIVCELVAALSTGRPLPGQAPLPRMRCWIMNAEDGKEDTISWRLHNQGADPDHVLVTDKKRTIDALRAKEITRICRENKIEFLCIDPMQSWMGKDLNMHQANETRDWGDILRGIALDCDLAVLIARHRRKAGPGDNKLMGGLGSIDITGYARSEIAAIKGKGPLSYVERIKGNVGETGQVLGFCINRHPDPFNEHGVLEWKGMMTAPSGASNVPKKLREAVNWLIGFLESGPRPSKDVLKAGSELKFSESTLKRAKKECAEAVQDPKSQEWLWVLRADVSRQVCE